MHSQISIVTNDNVRPAEYLLYVILLIFIFIFIFQAPSAFLLSYVLYIPLCVIVVKILHNIRVYSI